MGKLIHVTGSPKTGFSLEFKREYDFGETRRPYRIIPLAAVDERFIATPRANALAETDNTAHDRLEMAALSVDPPPAVSNAFASVCRLTILR